jgi:Ran GTPase-activating protein (RanGAP) involved in mRNA processing and transport
VIVLLSSRCRKKQKTNLKYKEVINLDFSGNKSFGNEGAFELAEELASNTSLTSLKLTGNAFLASFHSYTVQTLVLQLKEPSNYLKHSNQTRLSLYLISAVMYSLLRFVLTQYRELYW